MLMTTRFRGPALAGALAVAASALVLPQQARAWEPAKPIDLVVMAGEGGGADKMARLMQSIVEKHELASKPLVLINEPGRSGAEALLRLQNASGVDADHTIMLTLNSFYTTPLRRPALGVDPLAFVPIARMAEDAFLLWVHADSGVRTFDQFLTAAKEKGADWIMAGTGKGQEDRLITDFLNRNFDLNMKYVPYEGGGRVAKELAGRHADSTVNNPSEQLGFYEAGITRPIAAFSPQRLELFRDVPTMAELGRPFAYFMHRSVVGAPAMSDEAAAYYRAVFRKVYQSEPWQNYMKTKALQGAFMTGDELRAYWIENHDRHREMLKEIGRTP